MRFAEIQEGLKDPKDNPCWKGYKPVGTKKKAGRTVPNCVPVKEQSVAENFGYASRVQHPKYGVGQVIKVYPNGTITVNFPNYPDPIDKKPGVRPNFAPSDSDYRSLKPVVEAQNTDDDDDWYDDADEFGMPGSEFFPDDDDRLRDGDYVRDRQDGEHGEIFRMSGDPTERRVRILDRDGRGWYISPERLEPVDRMDPDILKYFGKKRRRDMDEQKT